MMSESRNLVFFFFNDTATTEIYTLSLHDALPISEAAALQADSRPHRIADLHLVLAKMYLHKNVDKLVDQLELYLKEAPNGSESDRVWKRSRLQNGNSRYSEHHCQLGGFIWVQRLCPRMVESASLVG